MRDKAKCRWHDHYGDWCRHPSHYADMKARGVFYEPMCNPDCTRCKGQYEEVDETHPAWDGGEDYQ